MDYSIPVIDNCVGISCFSKKQICIISAFAEKSKPY